MVSPDPQTEAKRRLLLSLIQQKRGYYAPPQAAPEPPPTPEPQRSGFMKSLGAIAGPIFQGSKLADALLPGDPGTAVKNKVSSIPYVGKPLAEGLDSLLSPFTAATLGFGGIAGAGLRGANAVRATGGFSKLAAPFVEPIVTGSLKKRLGVELAANLGGQGGMELAEQAGLPEPLQLAAGIAGGAIGIRTAANTAAKLSATAGGLTTDQVEQRLASGDSLDKFVGLMSGAKLQNKLQTAERSAELGKRAGAMRGRFTEGMSLSDKAKIAAQESVGELPTRPFVLDQQMEASDILAIREKVNNYLTNTNASFEFRRADDALNKLFLKQELPQKNEIELLEKALGQEFGMVLRNLKDPQKFASWQTVMDAIAVPRALMATGELSMPFRQGVLMTGRKSFWNSWKPMFKALGDENYAREAETQLLTSTDYITRQLRDNNILSTTAKSGNAIEEGYNISMAEVFPGVRQSGRAAVVFNDVARDGYARGIADNWMSRGIKDYPEGYDVRALAERNLMSTNGLTDDALAAATKHNDETFLAQKRVKDLVELTGNLSGRGKLPPSLENSYNTMNLLTSLLFSPKMLAARVNMLNPRTYMSMDPLVRKEAMRDMLTFFGTGVSGLTMLGMGAKAGFLPGVSVEHDPRSSDFGKVRVGQTRIDPWGGFQPFARYIAQFGMGEAKVSTSDTPIDRPRGETALNFFRGKMAPVPSFILDAFMGESFLGQEVDVSSGQGLDKAAAERLIPMFYQDMADAIRESGYKGALLTAPAAFGVGASTYSSQASIRQKGAAELYNKKWDKLDGNEKANVETAYKEDFLRQGPPSEGSFAAYKQQLDEGTRIKEQEYLVGMPTKGNKWFNDRMTDLMSARYNQMKGAAEYAGLNKEETTLVDQYFDLYDTATTDGIVDYEKLDQLQADFLAPLSSDQQRVITVRTGFDHVDSVKWWAADKKTIANSDYYDIKGRVLDKLDPLVQKLAPGVTTYNELLVARAQADPAQALILSNLIKRVDSVTKQMQKVFRLANPDVDSALTRVYGSTPIRLQIN